MKKIVSCWVKNPISSWCKDTKLDNREYETEVDLLQDVARNGREGGFVFGRVESDIVTTCNDVKVVLYEIECTTVYQETHDDVNQASWKLQIEVVEAINE